jgi:hypothetical protein
MAALLLIFTGLSSAPLPGLSGVNLGVKHTEFSNTALSG